MQEIDLVFHQRDQRRDDQSQTFQMKSAKLVAEALAAPSRKDREHGFVFQDFANNQLLAVAELVETKDTFQRRVNGWMGRIHDLRPSSVYFIEHAIIMLLYFDFPCSIIEKSSWPNPPLGGTRRFHLANLSVLSLALGRGFVGRVQRPGLPHPH